MPEESPAHPTPPPYYEAAARRDHSSARELLRSASIGYADIMRSAHIVLRNDIAQGLRRRPYIPTESLPWPMLGANIGCADIPRSADIVLRNDIAQDLRRLPLHPHRPSPLLLISR